MGESTRIPGAGETLKGLIRFIYPQITQIDSNDLCHLWISTPHSPRGSGLISSNMSWRRSASATHFAVCSVSGCSGSVLAISKTPSSSITTPSKPRVTPGVIRISSMLWMRKRPVCSTQSSMKGSRRACSASDSERYAPSTMRQYSRTSLDYLSRFVFGPRAAGRLSGPG